MRRGLRSVLRGSPADDNLVRRIAALSPPPRPPLLPPHPSLEALLQAHPTVHGLPQRPEVHVCCDVDLARPAERVDLRVPPKSAQGVAAGRPVAAVVDDERRAAAAPLYPIGDVLHQQQSLGARLDYRSDREGVERGRRGIVPEGGATAVDAEQAPEGGGGVRGEDEPQSRDLLGDAPRWGRRARSVVVRRRGDGRRIHGTGRIGGRVPADHGRTDPPGGLRRLRVVADGDVDQPLPPHTALDLLEAVDRERVHELLTYDERGDGPAGDGVVGGN